MRVLLYRLCDVLEAVFKVAGVTLFTVMIVTVFYEVVMRYVFNAPTFWSEPLARNAMIWLVLLGLAVGIRHRDNINVDFLVERFPPWLQPVLAWVRFVFVFAFAGVLLVHGYDIAVLNLRQEITGLEIPVFFVYIAIPIAAFGMLLFTLELIVKGHRGTF